MKCVELYLAGSPQSGRLWVRRSLAKLPKDLQPNFKASQATICRLLRKNMVSLKCNFKRLSLKQHPDRDRQFRFIKKKRKEFEALGLPIFSLDSKKRELVGRFKNPGKVWAKQAEEVFAYDFPTWATAKATPFGIYDVGRNKGFVVVGTSANTPEFAVAAVVTWWKEAGCGTHKGAKKMLFLADGGGSNGHRSRAWKYLLQKELVDQYGVEVTVCHYPTGASKWNPIEHRLFSEISKTWAGTPLTSLTLMLEAIRSTTTKGGLEIKATLLETVFLIGKKVTDAQMATLNIKRFMTCPNWNYILRPQNEK